VDSLWTPWRFQYISSLAGKQSSCIFCDALQKDQAEALLFHRGALCFLMLNRYPYTNGHVLVAPYRHIPTLKEATDPELHELIEWARRIQTGLEELYHPDGFNLGLNLGRSAGAGVEGHLHLHVVPRWSGDASFMSTIGDTRVIPEDLALTFARLRTYFQT